MVSLFYVFGILAVVSTVSVILHYNPMHAVLYLIVSFLSMSCIFFILGASFAGAVEIIVYAGAIMVLFVFIIMMLNVENVSYGVIMNREYYNRFLNVKLCCGVGLLASVFCAIMFPVLTEVKNYFICVTTVVLDLHKIGYKLFGFYLLVIEIVSFLLLGALISVLQISQEFGKCINSENTSRGS